jgi:nucleoside-diphosphate-sugar epimerase
MFDPIAYFQELTETCVLTQSYKFARISSLVSLEEILETTKLLLKKNNTIGSENKTPSLRNPVSVKAEKLLGWVPETNLSEGIKNCLKVMTNLRGV